MISPTPGEQRLRPGDEVMTMAAGFPTTVNPIIQNQRVPGGWRPAEHRFRNEQRLLDRRLSWPVA